MDEMQGAPAPEAPADSMCRSGLHYQYSPETDTFESAGPCDQHPEHAAEDPELSAMSQQAAAPMDTSNPAYRDYNGPQAGEGIPPSPEELARTQSLLQGFRDQLQGPKKSQRMGVPGAAEAIQKGVLGK